MALFASKWKIFKIPPPLESGFLPRMAGAIVDKRDRDNMTPLHIVRGGAQALAAWA